MRRYEIADRNYKIILPLRIRSQSIARCYKYIEAIQSYAGNWPSLIITGDPRRLRWDSILEGITPLPTTHGALCFPELYLSDEKLVEFLRSKVRGDIEGYINAIKSGEHIHRVIPYSLLKDIEKELEELIAGMDIEVFIPLRYDIEKIDNLIGSIPFLEEHEVFKASIPLVKSRLIEQALDRAHYVGEYLRELEEIFNEAMEEELYILRLWGFIDASTTLVDLEGQLQRLINKMPIKEGVLMFTRVIL